MGNMVLWHLIYYYFLLGMRRSEILMLFNVDGIDISMSTLCRYLRSLDCSDGNPSPTWWKFLQEKWNQYRMHHGYEFMHSKCIQAGFCVNGAVNGFSHMAWLHDYSHISIQRLSVKFVHTSPYANSKCAVNCALYMWSIKPYLIIIS